VITNTPHPLPLPPSSRHHHHHHHHHLFLPFGIFFPLSLPQHPVPDSHSVLALCAHTFKRVLLPGVHLLQTKSECLGTTAIKQNYIHDEINSRINSGNACYHSEQNLLPSRLLCKNLKISFTKLTFYFSCKGVKLGFPPYVRN